VSLPVLVCQDGFTITHAAEPVTLLDDEQVEAFVGPYTLGHSLLDTAHPATFGPFAMPDYYFELRRAQAAALESALSVFQFAAADLARLTGRTLAPASPYRLEDARTAVVALGSTCGTIKDAVDDLRASGVDAGLLQIRSFRPFPTQHARALLAAVPEVVVLDRADSPGGAPPLAAEIAYALRGTGTEVRSYVYGLGGRDLHPAEIADAVVAGTSRYLGLRGLACPA
jgi:pyruvate ferredoxin oxidoreductase alpha subunit